MKNFSLLITSCDSFEDCWIPFFTLYENFWNDQDLNIYLTTENKDFKFKKFNVTPTKSSIAEKGRLTWAQILINTLNKIETELVLIFMDDFFIQKTVDSNRIDELSRLMEKDDSIDAIYLTVNGPPGCSKKSNHQGLLMVDQFSDYKVSMQAGLWRKEVILSLLNKNENAWMFELFGSKRAHLKKVNFLRVATSIDSPINYLNGIIKGQWTQEVISLFQKNNIEINFQVRGFFSIKNKWIIKITTLRTLINKPSAFLYYFFIIPIVSRIKFKS